MKGVQITHHKGKGASSEILPNRAAVHQLTGGDAAQRSINNYAKLTPSIVQSGPDLLNMEPKP